MIHYMGHYGTQNVSITKLEQLEVSGCDIPWSTQYVKHDQWGYQWAGRNGTVSEAMLVFVLIRNRPHLEQQILDERVGG